jgi:hypothetical protein
MKTAVIGRIKNTNLPANKPLLPLYEAVVNSIQAIEDANEKDGRITIKIHRDESNLMLDQQPELAEITGFTITDNGIGFTDDNYDAFTTADTTFKAQRGGKGVGRFLWLVAFEKVEVESVFIKNDRIKRRSFRFAVSADGIYDHQEKDATEKSGSTEIHLIGMRQKYQQNCPKKTDTIAVHLVEHCLEYFIRPDYPSIVLNDPAAQKSIDLKELFDSEMAAKAKPDQIKVQDHAFDILHVRLYTSHVADHVMHFCANNRVVRSEKLIGRVPNLTRHLQDKNGKEFVYAAYIDSKFLDDNVNAERTDFKILEENADAILQELTWTTIRAAILDNCRKFLEPFTEPVREKKNERIEGFVSSEGPMYRPILQYLGDKIDQIDPEITDDELDIQLYQAYHDLQVDLHGQGQRLMKKEINEDDFEEFMQQIEDYFSRVSDINKSDLARYICHRRAVLDFLHKQLSVKSDGKYPLEERIHRVIFPLKKTSDEVTAFEHNLWLIDEKLVYHYFLASDKPLQANPKTKIQSRKEPDIIVFDKACAFVSGNDMPFSAVTIIEFKRPMRDNYKDKENPFAQVCDYISDIRSGKARTKDGRDIPIGKDIPFSCFIVCDITPALEDQAYKFELTKTPDGQGFFGYKRAYNAYIELVSYTKMITDAKKRNAAFFEKLALPTSIAL